MSPLLFIIVMEAFSRSLSVAAQGPNFEFHPKCVGIQLTHVSFADDIYFICWWNGFQCPCYYGRVKQV